MDIKQEVFEIKQEIIIKEEYISDFEAEDCSVHVTTHFPDKQSVSEKPKSTTTKKKRFKKNKLFKCGYCHFNTFHKTYLDKHKLKCKTRNSQKYFCANCSYSAKIKGYLSSHVRLHLRTKPFTCYQCDYETTRKDSLKRHIKGHSDNDKQADETAKEEHGLLRRKATTVNVLHCKLCDYRTIYKINMEQHILMHTAKKILQCAQCDYRTASKADLKQHLLVHTCEIYQCKQCDYKTIYKFNLQQHKLEHTGEQPPELFLYVISN